MPAAKYHDIIVIGNATIYRIRLVKLRSRKILPATPQANETDLSAMHLHNFSMWLIRQRICN
jgi:hypothetical protein